MTGIDLGGARFEDLTPERAREIVDKVAGLPDAEVQAIVAKLEAARAANAQYQADVAAARAIVSVILGIATLVA